MNAGWLMSAALAVVSLILAVMVLTGPMARLERTQALDYVETYQDHGFKFVCQAYTSDSSVAESLDVPPPVGWRMVTVCKTVAL